MSRETSSSLHYSLQYNTSTMSFIMAPYTAETETTINKMRRETSYSTDVYLNGILADMKPDLAVRLSYMCVHHTRRWMVLLLSLFPL
jgi:hypothetical protein